MADTDGGWIRRQRMRAQGLAQPANRRPADAVRLLAAVQSQELAHAFWSLALRSDATTEAEVRAAYDAGDFVRTHVLRPTWHFVAAEDVRWLLATTAGRVHQVAGGIRRRLGLDAPVLERSVRALADALADGEPRTRADLTDVLAAAGLPTTGEAPIHTVMHAELEQVIVSGPMRGKQHTYVLLDDRVPRTDRDGADPVRLVLRFLTGHGPASVRDVARWSSLTLTTVRAAVAEVADLLTATELDGETYYAVADAPAPGGTLPPVLLLPLYDELPLAYRTLAFPTVADHPHPPGTDQFVGSVFVDTHPHNADQDETDQPDANIGTWRREIRGGTVEIALDLAPSTSAELRDLALAQAHRLADFLQRDLDLR